MEPQDTNSRSGVAGVARAVVPAGGIGGLGVPGLGMTRGRARAAGMVRGVGGAPAAVAPVPLSVPTGVSVLVLVGAATLLVIKEGVIQKASVRLTLNLLAGLGLLALAALLVVALFLPLFTLTQQLS